MTSPAKSGEEHKQSDDGAATLAAMASSFRPRESSRGATLCTGSLAGHSAVRMRATQRLPICPRAKLIVRFVQAS